MSAQFPRGYFGISEVLAQLRADFPDISVSKIRFLETEGLLTPARSPSGYRRFCAADVDRLRYILAAQRDQYLPLRVIKERLARLEAAADVSLAHGQARAGAQARPGGAVHNGGGMRAGEPTLPAMQSRQPPPPAADSRPGEPLSRRELIDAAGLTDALLTELETFGLLRRVGRHYTPDAMQVARAAVALTAYGVEARHLRAVRAAAERETTMIESLVAPIQRQRGTGGRELAARTAAELAELVIRLHAALVDGALAEAGLVEPGPVQGRLAPDGLAGASGRPGRPDQSTHGAEGASA
jgi:DNA-binding transcriptional MerR regulator